MVEPSGAVDCYADLHKSDRAWLQRTARALRAHMDTSVRSLLGAGDVLSKARRRLGRDRWRPWLEAEAQIAPRTAYKYMRLSAAFAGVDADALKRFTVSALYALSDPSFPTSLREFCIEQAADGADVTLATVSEWRDAYFKPVRDSKKELAKLVSKDEKPPEPEKGEPFAAENWELLRTALGSHNTLMLSATTDVENGESLVSAVLVEANPVHDAEEHIENGEPLAGKRKLKRKLAAAPTLETALLMLTGTVREKQCRGKCKEMKKLEEFSALAGSKDGRNKYCLKCERARVGDYQRAKSATAKAG